jgi:hypothetical protein
MTMPDPIHLMQLGREFKNYNGNFLNIHLIAFAPSDFHLFGPLKKRLGGRCFADEEVETEVQRWLRQQSKDFCAAGLQVSTAW